jgi:folate-binding protein YgfZ
LSPALDRHLARIYIAASQYNVSITTPVFVPIRLPPPQLLELAGPDALAFAHAQFSSDVRSLDVGSWQWSAWLSAQGRVRAFFRLLRPGHERLLLVLNGGSAAEMKKALGAFVLRAKVRIDVIDSAEALGYRAESDIAARFGAAPHGGHIIEHDDLIAFDISTIEQRWCSLGHPDSANVFDDSTDALERWRADDIGAGIPELTDPQSDRFLPTWIALDRLGAVSVRKGCYPGQEIVARLHFKGGNKRWLYRLEFTGDELPPPGTALSAEAPDLAGELLNTARTQAAGGVGLAVLPEVAPGTSLRAMDGSSTADFRVVSAVGNASA